MGKIFQGNRFMGRGNGSNKSLLELKRMLTGKIQDAEQYPAGMTAIQFEIDGVKMAGVAGEFGRFDMDKVLRVLRILELYSITASQASGDPPSAH